VRRTGGEITSDHLACRTLSGNGDLGEGRIETPDTSPLPKFQNPVPVRYRGRVEARKAAGSMRPAGSPGMEQNWSEDATAPVPARPLWRGFVACRAPPQPGMSAHFAIGTREVTSPAGQDAGRQ
jgi:hypothetical protein